MLLGNGGKVERITCIYFSLIADESTSLADRLKWVHIISVICLVSLPPAPPPTSHQDPHIPTETMARDGHTNCSLQIQHSNFHIRFRIIGRFVWPSLQKTQFTDHRLQHLVQLLLICHSRILGLSWVFFPLSFSFLNKNGISACLPFMACPPSL